MGSEFARLTRKILRIWFTIWAPGINAHNMLVRAQYSNMPYYGIMRICGYYRNVYNMLQSLQYAGISAGITLQFCVLSNIKPAKNM